MRRWLLIACAAIVPACAARMPPRPDAPGVPHPIAIEEFTASTRRCMGLSTMTAELRLSGRAFGERLRGTLHTGLASPASVRFEAVAPFGQPVFILAGRGDRATLLFPREDQVIRDAPLPDVFERLTGLRLGARDLRMLLTGCLAEPASPREGRRYGGDWRSVIVGAETTAYVRDVEGQPMVVAADAGPWRVDYSNFLNGWPRTVRLRSTAGDVDMTAAIEQLEINTPIDDGAFDVEVPADAVVIPLEYLKSVAPLRSTGPE